MISERRHRYVRASARFTSRSHPIDDCCVAFEAISPVAVLDGLRGCPSCQRGLRNDVVLVFDVQVVHGYCTRLRSLRRCQHCTPQSGGAWLNFRLTSNTIESSAPLASKTSTYRAIALMITYLLMSSLHAHTDIICVANLWSQAMPFVVLWFLAGRRRRASELLIHLHVATRATYVASETTCPVLSCFISLFLYAVFRRKSLLVNTQQYIIRNLDVILVAVV